MTLETVPVLSIAGMAVAMLVSFALPIALFIYSKKKLHAKTAPFFIGCGVFVVMVVTVLLVLAWRTAHKKGGCSCGSGSGCCGDCARCRHSCDNKEE